MTSLIVVAVIAIATWGFLRKSVGFAMDFVPEHIDPVAVTEYLASLPGVTAVHDLHIWGMSTRQAALTAHLAMPEIDNADDLVARAAEDLQERFGIEHTTLQIERSDRACRVATDDVI